MGEEMKTRSLLLVLLAASSYAQTGTFTAAGNMTAPRLGHTATLLPNGKVLIAGGWSVCYVGTPCPPQARAELYDPSTGTFTPTGSMSTVYLGFATLLSDGKVLVAGQDITRRGASLELFDPVTENFTSAGKPSALTAVSSATLLSDGRVLLIGTVVGPRFFGAELYDPASRNFSPIPDWPGQQFWWPPIALADGTVLLGFEPESERYDPLTGAFSASGSIPYFDDIALRQTLLLNGNVLFTGSNPGPRDADGNIYSAELYYPAMRTFASTGSMSTARDLHSATLLPDGRVLIAGGEGQLASSPPPLASAEIYDPGTGGFSTTGSLTSSRYAHTATLLNNGQVLIVGGRAEANVPKPMGSLLSSLSSAELYTPAVLVPAPALLSMSGDGKGQGAIWHAQTGQIATADNPAAAGEALSMYTTSLVDGSVVPPQVIVGGRLVQVLYFGAAPGYPGYYQVNFVVPDGVPPGPAVSVRLTYIGRSSNAVTIGVQ
jgi:hypothetical protein